MELLDEVGWRGRRRRSGSVEEIEWTAGEREKTVQRRKRRPSQKIGCLCVRKLAAYMRR
jgi:hypothetical protein